MQKNHKTCITYLFSIREKHLTTLSCNTSCVAQWKRGWMRHAETPLDRNMTSNRKEKNYKRLRVQFQTFIQGTMLVPLPCSDVKCIALLQISSQDKEMLDMLQMLQWILVWSTYISDELRVVISCGLKLLQSLSWDALLFYARLKKLKARMYSFDFCSSRKSWLDWLVFVQL